MKGRFSKKTGRWLILVVIIYLIGGAVIYFFQDKFIFHPEKLAIDQRYEFDIPYKEINIPINKETNLNIVQFTVPDSSRKGIVLYFHGNKKNITRYASFASHFTRNHYEVWMMDYPGFGKTTGKLTDERIYQDALQTYKLARTLYPPDSIIIYGKSLGTGIAAQLASIRDCRQLLLETPYYSMDDLVKRYTLIYPSLIRYDFSTAAYLEKVTAPITLFHGTEDGLVPYSQSKKIVKEFPKAKLISFEGGEHNNLSDFPAFHKALDSLLAR